MARARESLLFGPFKLVIGERLLTKEGVPVKLGARTLDTLIALISNPNEFMTKHELLAAVWPDVTVDEGSLRFHIATLRKALEDGKDRSRYIRSVPGRGYSFVAPVLRSNDQNAVHIAAKLPTPNLIPPIPQRMVGRDEDVANVSAQLLAWRFVTIVGPGGSGKTTVAIAVAQELMSSFDGHILFVDFGSLSEPKLVAPYLASVLGLPVKSDDPIPNLIAHIRDKRMLVIFDTCEHVIEAAAHLSQTMFLSAPHFHIIATSREALRVEGEQVFRLTPLGFPRDDGEPTRENALSFPAIELFVDRAIASGADLRLGEQETATISRICRQLDGLPLAIELAAGRVLAHGLEQTALLLEQRLAATWPGRRLATPRHRSLHATFEWSYALLTENERDVFCRLGIFVGNFTISAALAVVATASHNETQILQAIESLVAKSLVAVRFSEGSLRYRLLDTARDYALEIGEGSIDRHDLHARHATYYWRRLEEIGAGSLDLSNPSDRARYLSGLGNVRAALDWSLGAGNDTHIGIGLASVATPVFLAMSLLDECCYWSGRGIHSLPTSLCGGLEEMRLQAAHGLSLMFTKGNSEDAGVALARGLELAERFGDHLYQLQLIGGLHLFHERIGDFRASLTYAERSEVAAIALGDPVDIAAAHSWLGISHHLMGNLETAQNHLMTSFRYPRISNNFNTIQIGFDYYNRARITLARNLWLLGCPDQAAIVAEETIAEAAALNHPVTLCMALIWAVTVFAWRRDWAKVEETIGRFIEIADRHSLGPYQAAGLGVKGELALRNGHIDQAIAMLQRALAALTADRYELLTTELVSALAEAQSAAGQSRQALATIDLAIEQAEQFGRLFTMPELQRIKGEIIAKSDNPDLAAVEASFSRSIILSRKQAAKAWELRATVDLARIRMGQGRTSAARDSLQTILAQFTEGMATADLLAASQLLDELSRRGFHSDVV